MPFHPSVRYLPLFGALIAGAASAQTPRYTFSGFGTIGLGVLDEADLEYRTLRAGGGADEGGSFELDTRLGLQLDVDIDPALAVTLQGVAREGEDDEPEVELEWAFVRWFVNDAVTLRAGRLALPAFAMSDHREVGYAITPARPPEDVYSQIPLTRYTGADLTLTGARGETSYALQVGAGPMEETLPDDLRIGGEDGWSGNLVLERGPVRLRLSRLSTRIETDSIGLDALAEAAAFTPGLEEVADSLASGSARGRFDSIALGLDLGRGFAQLEHTVRRLEGRGGRGNARSSSALVGLRLGTLTPFALASTFVDEADGLDVELPPSPLAAALEAVYEDRSQSTLGVGVRWDFASGFSLKGQVERVRSESTGVSLSRGGDPGARTGELDDVTLFAATLDFVF